MQLKFDTEAGVFLSTVHNYVEGGSSEVHLVMQAVPDQCPHCVGEAFQGAEKFVSNNLHDLYSLLDVYKRKKIQKTIRKLYLPLEQECNYLLSRLDVLPDDQKMLESLDDVRGQMDILDQLLWLKKSDLKSRLQFLGVEINHDTTDLLLFFGVQGLDIELITIKFVFDVMNED